LILTDRAGVVEAEQQARQRGLARAAVADDGHRLASADLKLDIEQDLPVGLVG
jgi:hypothetical protein